MSRRVGVVLRKSGFYPEKLLYQLGPVKLEGNRLSTASATVTLATGKQTELAQFLFLRYPYVSSKEDIIAYLWPNDEPEYARQIMIRLIANFREAIRPLGLKICSRYIFGYKIELVYPSQRMKD